RAVPSPACWWWWRGSRPGPPPRPGTGPAGAGPPARRASRSSGRGRPSRCLLGRRGSPDLGDDVAGLARVVAAEGVEPAPEAVGTDGLDEGLDGRAEEDLLRHHHVEPLAG